MTPSVTVIPSRDPRNDRYRWAVSSRGADDAFLRVTCLDCSVSTPDEPLGRIIGEISIPREVANDVAMSLLYDQMEAGQPPATGEVQP